MKKLQARADELRQVLQAAQERSNEEIEEIDVALASTWVA